MTEAFKKWVAELAATEAYGAIHQDDPEDQAHFWVLKNSYMFHISPTKSLPSPTKLKGHLLNLSRLLYEIIREYRHRRCLVKQCQKLLKK